MASHFYQHGMRDWVLMNLKLEDYKGGMLPWSETWVITVGIVWKWMNGDIFRSERIRLGKKIDMVNRSISETMHAWNGTLMEQNGLKQGFEEHTLVVI